MRKEHIMPLEGPVAAPDEDEFAAAFQQLQLFPPLFDISQQLARRQRHRMRFFRQDTPAER